MKANKKNKAITFKWVLTEYCVRMLLTRSALHYEEAINVHEIWLRLKTRKTREYFCFAHQNILRGKLRRRSITHQDSALSDFNQTGRLFQDEEFALEVD